MRYFLAAVLQFQASERLFSLFLFGPDWFLTCVWPSFCTQFHASLCDTAGWKGPLHECSIYNNKAAGDKFKVGAMPLSGTPLRALSLSLCGSHVAPCVRCALCPGHA